MRANELVRSSRIPPSGSAVPRSSRKVWQTVCSRWYFLRKTGFPRTASITLAPCPNTEGMGTLKLSHPCCNDVDIQGTQSTPVSSVSRVARERPAMKKKACISINNSTDARFSAFPSMKSLQLPMTALPNGHDTLYALHQNSAPTVRAIESLEYKISLAGLLAVLTFVRSVRS